jgi:hypothetical protein
MAVAKRAQRARAQHPADGKLDAGNGWRSWGGGHLSLGGRGLRLGERYPASAPSAAEGRRRQQRDDREFGGNSAGKYAGRAEHGRADKMGKDHQRAPRSSPAGRGKNDQGDPPALAATVASHQAWRPNSAAAMPGNSGGSPSAGAAARRRTRPRPPRPRVHRSAGQHDGADQRSLQPMPVTIVERVRACRRQPSSPPLSSCPFGWARGCDGAVAG